MAESFVFYESFYRAASVLDAADRLEFYDAIAEYAIDGTDPDINSTIAQALFAMAKPLIDANANRRLNGSKGGRPPKEKPMVSETENQRLEDEKPNVNVNENENVNVNEKRKRFTAPSVEDVKAYCTERGNKVDAQRFVDFYASNGWKVGSQPMKDWKACVRTWERGDTQRPAAKKAYQIESRNYDIGALERMVLNR